MSAERALPPESGFARPVIPLNMRPGPWRDQVPRRLAFEAAHPEVRISFLDTVWQAAVPEADGVRYVTERELADLLSVLEERFAQDSRPAALPPGGGPGPAGAPPG